MPFEKGNQEWRKRKRQSPGRPRRSVEERYLKAMQQVVTVKEWRTVVLVALSHAKAGDKAAREWLSNYLLGRPDQYTRLDVDADVIMRIVEADNWRGNGTNYNSAQDAPGPTGGISSSGEIQVVGGGATVEENDAGHEGGA